MLYCRIEIIKYINKYFNTRQLVFFFNLILGLQKMVDMFEYTENDVNIKDIDKNVNFTNNSKVSK